MASLIFFVHPALFWTFGLGSARRVVNSPERHIPLADEDDSV